MGMSSTLRSLLNGFVEAHHIATLNVLIALLDYAGIMVASPILFGLLKKGVELGGGWIGLPYLFAAALFLVATVIVFAFKVPAESTRVGDEGEAVA